MIHKPWNRVAFNIQKQYSTVKFPQPTQDLSTKPKLSQFKNPLFHTFLLASTTYIILHTIWLNLEFNEKKRTLEYQSKDLEEEIQNLVDDKKANIQNNNKRSWYPRFWK